MTLLTLIQGGKVTMEDAAFGTHEHDGSPDTTCSCHALVESWASELKSHRGGTYASDLKIYASTVWTFPLFFSCGMRFIQEWDTPAEQPMLAWYTFWMLHNFTDDYCRPYEGGPGNWIVHFSYRDVWPDLNGNQRRAWFVRQKEDFRRLAIVLKARDDFYPYEEWQETVGGTLRWPTSLPKDRLLVRMMHALMRSLLLCREKQVQAYLLEQQSTKLALVR